MAYGCHEERYPLPIAAVDTHRPRPNRPNRKLSIASPTGVSGTASVGEVPEPMSRATIARDYFGDSGHSHPITTGGSGGSSSADRTVSELSRTRPGTADAMEGVRAALQRDADTGMLRPKVAGNG